MPRGPHKVCHGAYLGLKLLGSATVLWEEEGACLPACLYWQHVLRRPCCFEKEEHLRITVADPWPINIYCAENHRLLMTVTTSERGKWSSLPFPCLCAYFKVRFLSLLCILADTLSVVCFELLEHSIKRLPSLAAHQF